MKDWIVTKAKELLESAKEKILAIDWKQTGKDIIEGIISGFTSMVTTIGNTVSNLFSGLFKSSTVQADLVVTTPDDALIPQARTVTYYDYDSVGSVDVTDSGSYSVTRNINVDDIATTITVAIKDGLDNILSISGLGDTITTTNNVTQNFNVPTVSPYQAYKKALGN